MAAPTIDNTEADWQGWEGALVRIQKIQESTVDAIDRIAATRKDVEVVLQKLQPKDKKKEPSADSKDDPNKALKDAAKNLQKKLTEMEKRLWVSPDVKGIIDDRSLMAEVEAAGRPRVPDLRAPEPHGPDLSGADRGGGAEDFR